MAQRLEAKGVARQRVSRMRGAGVEVEGLAEFQRALRRLEDADVWQQRLKTTNIEVAELVVREATSAAGRIPGRQGNLARSAADTLQPTRGARFAAVSFGGARAPWAGGAEFGADRNKRRLIKNTGGRATVVRDDEDIRRVIRRVEAQTVDARGRTVSAREGGMSVRVQRTVVGWNQFLPWRGNDRSAGYFLFPAIRANIDDIIEMYGDGVGKIARDAFPEAT